MNPFLVDVSEREQGCQRNLFQEAQEKGYLVCHEDGSPYLVQNTSFSAGMVDLTNPEAWAWLKTVLHEQVLGAGVSGGTSCEVPSRDPRAPSKGVPHIGAEVQ